ncbi:LysR substrate-binding domain-containing protein [Paraburkholderia sediminicola]|uniref:LysR substrate-binding domain-containing protein n=1 Tax=Paraburkholderia sediminicola TaxID=458836 RepID=UPI0038B7BF0E
MSDSLDKDGWCADGWRRFPSIHVDLRELTSTEQIESLRARRIALGIAWLPPNNAAAMEVRAVQVERFVAVLPKEPAFTTRQKCAARLRRYFLSAATILTSTNNSGRASDATPSIVHAGKSERM